MMHATIRRKILAGTILYLLGLVGAPRAQPTDAQNIPPLRIGEPMPLSGRAMQGVGGEQIALDDAAGEAGTLVVFWAGSCPWVQRYEERMIDLAREYQPKGIGVIAVNPNDAAAYPEDAFAEMQNSARRAGYPFPYVVDQGSELAQAFGASRTPEVYLFNSGDQLVYRGAIDDNPRNAAGVEEAYLRRALTALLGGSSIQRQTSKPFGCTIKWQ